MLTSSLAVPKRSSRRMCRLEVELLATAPWKTPSPPLTSSDGTSLTDRSPSPNLHLNQQTMLIPLFGDRHTIFLVHGLTLAKPYHGLHAVICCRVLHMYDWSLHACELTAIKHKWNRGNESNIETPPSSLSILDFLAVPSYPHWSPALRYRPLV